MRIHLVRVSFWFTTIIPTLIFLGSGGLAVYLGYDYFGVNENADSRSEFLNMGIGLLGILGGVVVGILAILPTHKHILAIGRRRKVGVELIDRQLRFGKHSIDLGADYYSFTRSGETPNKTILTQINITQGEQDFNICLTDMQRADALSCFPDERFVGDTPYSTEYGVPGFECEPDQPNHLEFMQILLRGLFETKHNNRRHQIYSSFPWDKTPAPDNTHIQTIDPDNTADQAFLETIRQDVLHRGPNYELTAHYAVITTKEYIDKTTTFVVPVGVQSADIEEKHYSTPNSHGGVSFKQRSLAVLYGTAPNGDAMSIYVDVLPQDGRSDEHTNLAMLVIYMNERWMENL